MKLSRLRKLVKGVSFPKRLFRFLYYKVPATLKNTAIGFLNAKSNKHQCIICGNKQLEFVHACWWQYFLRCDNCNIYFAAIFLGTDQHSAILDKDSETYWRMWTDWKKLLLEKLNLDKFESSLGKPRTALEIGCGEGKLMQILEKREWQTIGLDVNEKNVTLCKNKGLNVMAGSAEKKHFQNESIDLVVMFHTLEHTVNPMIVLKNIFNVLKKGGRLILEVPYFDTKKSFVEDFGNMAHFYFFSEKAIEKMLQINAFNYLNKVIYEDKIHKGRRNICYLIDKR